MFTSFMIKTLFLFQTLSKPPFALNQLFYYKTKFVCNFSTSKQHLYVLSHQKEEKKLEFKVMYKYFLPRYL